MSYQVLALKYRPQCFEDVVGQAHVTTTLVNAISSNRVAHALLFTGPRGTGKTTIARILAKAMACSQGPSPTPCNVCKICTDITHGHCADVFEIDGASNNSVDQIRDLRENVTYMPASARVKIYIIDEVHMLSTAAFNALLKTLEEPPEHVVFIFATTEVHKIPATILSRCQRHDLSRVSLEEISGHLGNLCEKEGFSLDKEGLDLIAMEADGSIRDSLSLLDRVLSASTGSDLTLQMVQESLGVMDRQLMAELATAVFQRQGAPLIDLVDRINDSGQDLKKFYADIILYFRNLNIIRLCGHQNPPLNLTRAEKETLGTIVAPLSQEYVTLLLQVLLENEALVRQSGHTRTAVEMVLLKLIRINPGMQLDQIIAKLDVLARQIDTQLSAGHGIPAPDRTSASPPPATAPPSQPQEMPSQKVPSQAPRTPQRQPEPPAPVPPSYADQAYSGQPVYPETRGPAPGQPPPTPEPPVQEEMTWPIFLEKIHKRLPSISALLSRGHVREEEDRIYVDLTVRSDFEKSRLKTKNGELQSLSKQFLGKSIELKLTGETQKPKEHLETRKAEDRAKQEASMHPMVQEVRRLFDGEIIL